MRERGAEPAIIDAGMVVADSSIGGRCAAPIVAFNRAAVRATAAVCGVLDDVLPTVQASGKSAEQHQACGQQGSRSTAGRGHPRSMLARPQPGSNEQIAGIRGARAGVRALVRRRQRHETLNDFTADHLELCRRGDARGLEALFRAHGDRIFRVALAVLGQHADAEDAAQEVLLRTFAKLPGFAGRSRLSTWIYRVTLHHCLNLRRRRVTQPLPLADDSVPSARGPSPLEESSASEQRELLLQRLRRLGPALHAVLVLREVEGLRYDEIAAVLDIPIGTVMSRLARARRKVAWLAPSDTDDDAVPNRRNGSAS